MQPQANSEQFIDLFTEIEQKLRDICNDRYHAGFTELVRKARSFNPVVQQYANDLREFAELRNAITHTRRENFIIAEPHNDVVAEIRKIRDMLNNPPRVNTISFQPPFFATPQTPIMEMLKTFAEKGFMRCPVVDRNRIVCLITAKALARWLTEKYAHQSQLDGALLEEIIPYTDIRDFAVVSNHTDIMTIYDMFKRYMKQGSYLQAILVTENGSPTGHIIGILTPSDLPKLVERMD